MTYALTFTRLSVLVDLLLTTTQRYETGVPAILGQASKMAPSVLSSPQPSGTTGPKPARTTTSIVLETAAEGSPGGLPSPPPLVNRLVQDVIRDQVLANPHAPAVYSQNGHLTYKELDDTSSRLAQHIVERGIRRDSIVPILSEKVSNDP